MCPAGLSFTMDERVPSVMISILAFMSRFVFHHPGCCKDEGQIALVRLESLAQLINLHANDGSVDSYGEGVGEATYEVGNSIVARSAKRGACRNGLKYSTYVENWKSCI